MLLAYLVPLAVLVAVRVDAARARSSRARWPPSSFVEALRTQRLVDLPHAWSRAGLAATLPAPAVVGHHGAALGRRRATPCWRIVVLAAPVGARRAASRRPLPVQAFNYLEHHPGRIFTEYTWGDYSIARHRATFVDGRTDLFEGNVLTEFFAVTT